MNIVHLIFRMTELPTCAERETYLGEQEECVRTFLQGNTVRYGISKGAEVKPFVHGLAGAWQAYLTLPGDVRPNQVIGIIHASAWMRFKQANKFAQDYKEMAEGKAPEKVTALERELIRTEYTREDMRIVQNFRR